MEILDQWKAFRTLRDQLYAVHVAASTARVGNPLSGGPAADRGLLLRDSIIYRLESASFHIDLINRRQAALERVVHPLEYRAIELVRTASRDEKFFLDDIVFSLVSLFDYFGSWCDHLYNKEVKALRGFRLLRISAERRNAENADIEPANNRLRGTEVVAQAYAENGSWLKGLAAYRGTLAHGRADPAGGYYRHSFTSAGQGSGGALTTDVRITVPESLLKMVFIIRQIGTEPTVLAAAHRLTEEAVEALRRLLLAIVRDPHVAKDPNVANYLSDHL